MTLVWEGTSRAGVHGVGSIIRSRIGYAHGRYDEGKGGTEELTVALLVVLDFCLDNTLGQAVFVELARVGLGPHAVDGGVEGLRGELDGGGGGGRGGIGGAGGDRDAGWGRCKAFWDVDIEW